MKEKFKLTPLEKSWILYDIANSAFVLLAATLIPIFFNAVAGSAGLSETQYLSYWGYAGSISTLLVAFIGPVCGALTVFAPPSTGLMPLARILSTTAFSVSALASATARVTISLWWRARYASSTEMPVANSLTKTGSAAASAQRSNSGYCDLISSASAPILSR